MKKGRNWGKIEQIEMGSGAPCENNGMPQFPMGEFALKTAAALAQEGVLTMLVAPSMLASDFSHLADELKKITDGGADYVHLDVMDGAFVPNISFGAPVIAAMRPHTSMLFDVHLMIQHPKRYIADFAKAGADIISFHVECADDPAEVIAEIVSHGVKPAMVLKPNTPAESIFPYLDKLYMVLLMTVEPGFGGQSFMPEPLLKARQLKEKNPSVLIEADGGINAQTVLDCAQAGVDICVAGTGVFKATDPARAIRQLQSAGC